MLIDKNISVIILAGGSSRRMGRDKRLLTIDKKTLIEHTIELAKSLSNDLIISANDSLPEFNNHNIVEDILPGKGPLVGLTSGLKKIKYDSTLLLSCDMPMISKSEINILLNNYSPNSIILWKYKEQIQPMPGIYPKSIVQDCLQRIKNDKLSIINMIKSNNPTLIKSSDILHSSFLNLNYPEDYSRYMNKKH